MPKLSVLTRLTRRTTVVASILTLAAVAVVVTVVLTSVRNGQETKATYKEVVDLGATAGNNEQYSALSGFAVSNHGYAVIANGNLSLYGTDGKLRWTVKGTDNLSFDKIDAGDDGIAVFAYTPPTGDAPSSGLFNNDISGSRIIKYDYNGNEMWHYQLPDNYNVTLINYWGSDDVGVAGDFSGSMTIGQDMLKSMGGKDIALVDVTKKNGSSPTATLNKQIGTSGDDTVISYERYTTTEYVLNIGGSNVTIHARAGSALSDTTLTTNAGTYACDCATGVNADGSTSSYQWFRLDPGAVQVTQGQNVGTVVLAEDNQSDIVQSPQDQNNNNDSGQPQYQNMALQLQKVNDSGLQTDTKQITEFNNITGGNFDALAATDNNLVTSVNNNGSAVISIYGTNLNKQSEYTISNFWPDHLYEFKSHIYLSGYLIPNTTHNSSSDMKIYKVF